MGEGFEEVGFEHSGRRGEEPVRGIDEFEVGLVVDVPYLGHERTVWLDYPAYLFLEASDDHSVGHDKGEGVMKLHLLLDGLEMFVFEEDASSGVMALEGGYIEDVIVEYEQSFACFLGVAFDLVVVFEFQISLFSFGCHQLYNITDSN